MKINNTFRNKMAVLRRLLFLIISLLLFGFEGIGQCTVNITGDVTLCQGESTLLTAEVPPEAGSVIFSWKKDGVTIPSATTFTLNTGVLSSPGTFTYSVTISGGTCATPVSDDQVVTVNAKPTASFTVTPDNTMTNPLCASSSIAFNAQETGVTYGWNFGDASSASNTSSAKSPSHTFTTGVIGCSTTQFTVTLITTNAQGCSETQTKQVKVKQLPDVTLITPGLGKPFTQCNGNATFPMSISYSPVVSGCTNNPYQVSWGDEAIPGTYTYSSSTPPSMENHTYNGTGTWPLMFKVTGSNGCVNQRTYNVFNGSNPSLTFGSPGSTNGCVPYTVDFNVSGTNNAEGTYYEFDFGDGSPINTLASLTSSIISHTYTTSSCGNTPSPGTINTYTAKATAINACNTVGTSLWANSIAVSSQPNVVISSSASNHTACQNTYISFSLSGLNGCQTDPSGSTLNEYNITWSFDEVLPVIV